MQRLYSTFPNAWPGAGLLLLRCGQAAAFVFVNDWSSLDAARLSILTVGVTTSGLLAVGLWTPIAAVVLALTQGMSASLYLPKDHLIIALMALSLAMLGPGSWSFDARLFGRRRIKLADYED